MADVVLTSITFSILSRIERAVTVPFLPLEMEREEAFSILSRIEWAVT